MRDWCKGQHDSDTFSQIQEQHSCHVTYVCMKTLFILSFEHNLISQAQWVTNDDQFIRNHYERVIYRQHLQIFPQESRVMFVISPTWMKKTISCSLGTFSHESSTMNDEKKIISSYLLNFISTRPISVWYCGRHGPIPMSLPVISVMSNGMPQHGTNTIKHLMRWFIS